MPTLCIFFSLPIRPQQIPQNWNIQYQPVGLPTRCSIGHLVLVLLSTVKLLSTSQRKGIGKCIKAFSTLSNFDWYPVLTYFCRFSRPKLSYPISKSKLSHFGSKKVQILRINDLVFMLRSIKCNFFVIFYFAAVWAQIWCRDVELDAFSYFWLNS